MTFPARRHSQCSGQLPAGSTCSDVETPSARQRCMASAPPRRRFVGQQGGAATLWQPGGCGTALPSMFSGASAGAHAVNGDGTIVGGTRAIRTCRQLRRVPVRWTSIGGQWQIEQLDARPGVVHGANGAGEFPAGHVSFPCALADGRQPGRHLYAAGGSLELGTLGGAVSFARDINGSGEVVGLEHARSRIGNTGFFCVSVALHAAAAVQRHAGLPRQCRKPRATGRHASRRRHELAGRRSRVGRSQPLSV